MGELILDFVVEGLQRRKGEWRRICEETSVPYSSLAKIAQGHNANPTIDTVQRLVDYLKADDAKRRKKAVPA